jgi:hypothetical protein
MSGVTPRPSHRCQAARGVAHFPFAARGSMGEADDKGEDELGVPRGRYCWVLLMHVLQGNSSSLCRLVVLCDRL